jgi:type I restriction enzyme S subunit
MVMIQFLRKCKSHYEKLGEKSYGIPENWVKVTFGEVCNIFNGNSINETEKAEKYIDITDGLNYIGTKDISFNSKINYENGVKIPFVAVNNFKIAHARTPLLCIEGGSAGRKIGILTEDVCFGNKLCAFESEIINTKFLYYFLQSPEFQNLFNTSKSGLIGGVSINNIKGLSFALPPLAEQSRIVENVDLLLNQINLLKE